MATIVMSAEKVIEAAETTILYIEETRKKEDERMIAQYLKHNQKPGWMLRLGFKNPTREIAVTKLSADTWGFFPSTYAWGDYSKAKDLLKLAQHGDPVTLNEKDIKVLF